MVRVCHILTLGSHLSRSALILPLRTFRTPRTSRSVSLVVYYYSSGVYYLQLGISPGSSLAYRRVIHMLESLLPGGTKSSRLYRLL